jgi:Phage integrase family
MARALDREQLAARRGASDPLGERRLRAVVRARDREQGACRRQPGRRARAARPQSRSRCASGWKTTRSSITSTFAGSLRGRHLSAPDRAAFLGRRHRPLALERRLHLRGQVVPAVLGHARAAVRSEFRQLAARAGVRRRFAPHQLRHAHALELARESVPLNIIERQLGQVNLGTTSIYLQGIDPEEIIATESTRRAPMMSASAGLRL